MTFYEVKRGSPDSWLTFILNRKSLSELPIEMLRKKFRPGSRFFAIGEGYFFYWQIAQWLAVQDESEPAIWRPPFDLIKSYMTRPLVSWWTWYLHFDKYLISFKSSNFDNELPVYKSDSSNKTCISYLNFLCMA